MRLLEPLFPQTETRCRLTSYYHQSEEAALQRLLAALSLSDAQRQNYQQQAQRWIREIRTNKSQSGVEHLIHHYDLSCEEGVLLMCIAEALLRIPDSATADLLIRDKIMAGDWDSQGEEKGLTGLTIWGLNFTAKLFSDSTSDHYFTGLWKRLAARTSEGLIRRVLKQAMKQLGHHFILGQTISEAQKTARKTRSLGYTHSFDMLGEAAFTKADAARYFHAYTAAIAAIAGSAEAKLPALFDRPGISIKLSALYPRYEFSQQRHCLPFLIEKIQALARQAKVAGMNLTLDAEEADRLDLSLDIFSAVFVDPELQHWEGFGLAVQAYDKRALGVLDVLIALAKQQGRRIPVRLVKGAYWDTEMKRAQMAGFSQYPVYTRKNNTDVSYLACAQKMLQHPECIYAQFATHNAVSIAAILQMTTPNRQQFEFQRLQGMGQALHDLVLKEHAGLIRSRIYAPVGTYQDLLPYLVRRLLENGANSSFVNKIYSDTVSVETLARDPLAILETQETASHPKIPLPEWIYQTENKATTRRNSQGVDFTDYSQLQTFSAELAAFSGIFFKAKPRVAATVANASPMNTIRSPFDLEHVVGEVQYADSATVDAALAAAQGAFPGWKNTSVENRALCLERFADLLEKHRAELVYLTIYEAGKTVVDALSDWREAVDFCRYYASEARRLFCPQPLHGYTGEKNTLLLQGRGVFLCISPWNFPLAIFTGQVVAALVAGNAVIAKPAEQTNLCADKLVALLHAAGIPPAVLQSLPGRGEHIGPLLVRDARIAGIIFTGSNETAAAIQNTLAQRPGPIVPFIAETGGINAMIVDSSALPEQVATDVLRSAFGCAGQRCSALRVLYLQEEIADRVIPLLRGAMAELVIGRPDQLETDVASVIDEDASDRLLEHQARMEKEATLIYRCELGPAHAQGYFIAPQAYELKALSVLCKEVFGPILHVIRFPRRELDRVISEINALGFGLTFGVHSRIDSQINSIVERIHAGNIYVNRNIIGAVVGVQPFGGSGLSGTGPKAGGPHYLLRLCDEKVVTINTTAMGGNASLMTLDEQEFPLARVQ